MRPLFSTFAVLLLLPVKQICAGKFYYQIGGEGGLYRASTSVTASENFLVSRFDVTLQYSHPGRGNMWSIRGHLRPEFYSLEKDFRSLYVNVKGQFLQKFKNLNLGVKLLAERQKLSIRDVDLTLQVYQIGGTLIWFSGPATSVAVNLEYAAYNVDALLSPGNAVSSILTSLTLFKVLNGGYRWGFGVYAEPFQIKSEGYNVFPPNSIPVETINEGFRWGPEFVLEYKRRLVISGSYRFLLYQSDVTDWPSYEHWIRLLFGKVFSPQWSLFFLMDYYFRDLSLKDPLTNRIPYALLNRDNRLYLKLAREMNSNVELFFRLEYLNENFTTERLSVSGWRGTVGFELSK